MASSWLTKRNKERENGGGGRDPMVLFVGLLLLLNSSLTANPFCTKRAHSQFLFDSVVEKKLPIIATTMKRN